MADINLNQYTFLVFKVTITGNNDNNNIIIVGK